MAEEEVQGEDPKVLLKNYERFSNSIAVPISRQLTDILNDEEQYPVKQITIADDEQFGPGSLRAFCTALLGLGPQMTGGPYKLMESMRFWNMPLRGDGISSLAEVLRLGGAEIKLSYLELMKCDVEPSGCFSLGSALSNGGNQSLLTLKFLYDPTIGSEGCAQLCRGLRTNRTLKRLELGYCGIDAEGARSLGEVIGFQLCGLNRLNLMGNLLGGEGLMSLCEGLRYNRSLTHLVLADNRIGSEEVDLEALDAFADILLTHPELKSIDFMYNHIGEEGANVLVRGLPAENERVTEFLVDATLPMELFERLFRKSAGKGKKGKKGGKKKKKK
jgi:hypothetical protein